MLTVVVLEWYRVFHQHSIPWMGFVFICEHCIFFNEHMLELFIYIHLYICTYVTAKLLLLASFLKIINIIYAHIKRKIPSVYKGIRWKVNVLHPPLPCSLLPQSKCCQFQARPCMWGGGEWERERDSHKINDPETCFVIQCLWGIFACTIFSYNCCKTFPLWCYMMIYLIYPLLIDHRGWWWTLGC